MITAMKAVVLKACICNVKGVQTITDYMTACQSCLDMLGLSNML